MGLSLGVLTALLVLLPGIAFAFGLTKLHAPGKPTPKPFDQYFSPLLILVLIAAIVLHGLWMVVWNLWSGWTGLLVDPGQVLPVLAGDVKAPAGDAVIHSLSAYPLRIGFYFLSITLFGFVAGKFSNRFFRDRHSATWYSLLHPKDADFIWLTADIKLDSECYLIAGIVDEFNVSPDGKLERVVLRAATRRPLHCDQAARERLGTVDGWTSIPGEFIVLQMEHARTINVDYFYINEDAAASNADPTPVDDDGSG